MQQQLDGRYEILKPLGTGGFSKTYLARDLRIPGTSYCVVKQLHCISKKPEDVQLAQQLFQREAESLAKLGHHDQIPRLLAYFTENNEFYLVEDFIDGRSLDDEIQPGQPWAETAVIDLIKNVLDVLAFVHQQGVIHRDIKPSNLIRRHSDGKIVLIDFGAIKQIELAHPNHRTGTQIGTAGYMPPEQAQGKPRPNSDIYGTGMVGIAALTGQPAIGLPDDPQTGEILWEHLATVSPNLAHILKRMVRYHFQHRYQTIEEVQQALQGLGHGLKQGPEPQIISLPTNSTEAIPTQVASPAVSAKPTSPPSATPSQVKKGAPWLLGIGLAILIPILGGVASLLFNPRTSFTNPVSRSQEDSTSGPCTAVVVGNIRSERTVYYGDRNILQTGQGKSYEVGGRETRGGWLEIKLPSGKTAWTHLDVVPNEADLKNCLSQKNISLATISDIPPPPRPQPRPVAPQPSPPTEPTEQTEKPTKPNEESNDKTSTDAIPTDDPAPPESTKPTEKKQEEGVTPASANPTPSEDLIEESQPPEETAPPPKPETLGGNNQTSNPSPSNSSDAEQNS